MEVYAPPAHYGEYIQHSVAITPAFAFVLYSICGSFEVQKQSVSNAFIMLRSIQTFLFSTRTYRIVAMQKYKFFQDNPFTFPIF